MQSARKAPPHTSLVFRSVESLPIDPAHVPFELILIPAGAEEPPIDSSERQFRLRLPRVKETVPINEATFIDLIDVKNDYKIAGIVNGLLSIAIAVSLLCFGIITGVAPLLAFGISFAGWNIYHLYENKSLIQEIRTNGLPHFQLEVN